MLTKKIMHPLKAIKSLNLLLSHQRLADVP